MVEQKQFSKQQIVLLESLAEFYNIYVVLDRFNFLSPEIYICDEFREAANNINYHSLRLHVRVTGIVSDNSSYVNSVNSLKIITTKIDNMTPITKERKYSKEFYWIKF